ncbi:proline-rich receptor-like protein kinase PERK2 [Pipra filicauda]|uniref:Proline-rich receptor-like protein kinase PERK2 n=1 Tax=Pipra filicauda TaxID=649802 RepID=A0A7R5L3C2_9PASS|nr:proline-rich receptor-like protein kinase PERK2 [Pipra filicauda]
MTCRPPPPPGTRGTEQEQGRGGPFQKMPGGESQFLANYLALGRGFWCCWALPDPRPSILPSALALGTPNPLCFILPSSFPPGHPKPPTSLHPLLWASQTLSASFIFPSGHPKPCNLPSSLALGTPNPPSLALCTPNPPPFLHPLPCAPQTLCASFIPLLWTPQTLHPLPCAPQTILPPSPPSTQGTERGVLGGCWCIPSAPPSLPKIPPGGKSPRGPPRAALNPKLLPTAEGSPPQLWGLLSHSPPSPTWGGGALSSQPSLPGSVLPPDLEFEGKKGRDSPVFSPGVRQGAFLEHPGFTSTGETRTCLPQAFAFPSLFLVVCKQYVFRLKQGWGWGKKKRGI